MAGAGPPRHPSLDDRWDPAIRIVEWDPGWPVRAAEELRRIVAAVGAAAVRADHVGSTAVPGLAAKPILDLQLSVVGIEPQAAYVEPLERLGYLHVPDPGSPDYVLFAKPPERPRQFHLHVCAAGSGHEARHLAVRDLLRADPAEAAAYAALKRGLADRHPGDRLAYIAGKEDHVVALERRAVAWAGGDVVAPPVVAPPVVAAVSRGARHGLTKSTRDGIRLVAGLGVEGDAHSGRTVQHRSRAARTPNQPNLRQVHLIQAELLDELRGRGFDVLPGAMGENVTTRGIDLLGLPTGARLALGDAAVVEVTGLRNPCVQLDRFRPGLMAAVLDRDAAGRLVRRAGVMAVVLESGDVRAADPIAVELPPSATPLRVV